MRPDAIRTGRVLIGLTALAAVAGCAPGTGPNFVRLINDTGRTVQVREITQSNSPSCLQPGYIPSRGQQILLTPNGECVLTAGRLDPGQLVALSLGSPKNLSVLPPIVVVNGDGVQRCMVLPLPISRSYGTAYPVSDMQPGGCDG